MSSQDIMRAAPLIRGLSFDGRAGLYIAEIAQEKGPAQLQLTGVDTEILSEEFSSFIAETQSFPMTVGLPDGTILGLGSTYDEAHRGEGCSRTPGQGASASRDDIVRDKIAVVTGGAQGFGAGMVRGLAEAGAFVVIADMNLTGAQGLADELNARAGKTTAIAVKVNVTDEESVESMIDEILRSVGGIDIFISNAGVLRAGSVKEMTLKDFSFVTSVDYTGFFICTKHASKMMALQHDACADYRSDIIAISSKSGLEGSNKNGAYAGAKFGTIGLTQSFALELVTDGIKVNAICPGNFLDGPLWSDPDRGLFVQYLAAGKVPGAKSVEDVRRFYESKVPLDRGCTTEDVMRALLYCVEQQYETGQAVPVTGGQVMLN